MNNSNEGKKWSKMIMWLAQSVTVWEIKMKFFSNTDITLQVFLFGKSKYKHPKNLGDQLK